MSRFTVAVAVTAVLSVACRDQQPLQTRSMTGPAFLISDGAHSGNAFFFFLPPLVANPSAFFHAGLFNAGLSPVVDVCILDHDPRLLPPTPAATCVGSQFGPAPMALDLANQQYTRNWDTQSPPLLDPSKFYRIQVRGASGGTILGFVDVDPVDQGVKNLRTGEVIQFQDGRTLPIKVRIENRAYCNNPNTDCVSKTVGTAGGDVLAENAGIRFFPGNLPGDRVVIIEEVPLKSGQRCLVQTPDGESPRMDLLEYPPCYRFRTDPGPTAFIDPPGDTPFPTAAICPDLSALPASLATHRQLFQEEHAAGLPDANADFLPCTIQIGSRTGSRGLLARLIGLVLPRPAFAVDFGAGGSTDGFSMFINAVQTSITAFGLTDQTVARGQVLLDSVRVTAIHPRAGEPLSGVPVGFTTSDGSVSTTNPVLTNSTGFGITNWSLPLPAGTSKLTASASAIGSPVQFIASSSASFDFETYPDETVTCSVCGVTNEFAGQGVGFQWQSTFTNTTATLADGNGSLYGDAGNLGNNFVTWAVNAAGQGLSGVLTMALPGHPRTVEFDWSTGNDVAAFPVTAFDASGSPIPSAQITHTLLRTYTSVGGFTFKWERVSITSASLIQRVVFDMNSFGQQIDNVSINPVVIP